MESSLKEWVLNKLHNDSGWLERHFIEPLDKIGEKAHLALHRANRDGTIDQIKYNQGYFDGVQSMYNLLESTMIREQTIKRESELPAAKGSIWRMFGLGD